MKNNKGFSLVELIIVIAIMAILVGVMAPQLIKYIEKTNVSADTQLCDSVKTAIVTAMMDPSVIANDSATINSFADDEWHDIDELKGETDTAKFKGAVADILGFDPASTTYKAKLKSSCTKNNGVAVKFIIVGSNAVHVAIDHSDSTGKKGDYTINGNDHKEIYVD